MPVSLEVYCSAKLHCQTCRAPTLEGESWRRSLHKYLSPQPDSINWACPHGVPWNGGEPPKPASPDAIAAQATANESRRAEVEASQQKLNIAGRLHWQRFHAKRNWTPEEFQAWVRDVPSFGCACRTKTESYVKHNPPDLSTAESAFKWGLDYHNFVNRDLGKPEMTLAAARERWNFEPLNSDF